MCAICVGPKQIVKVEPLVDWFIVEMKVNARRIWRCHDTIVKRSTGPLPRAVVHLKGSIVRGKPVRHWYYRRYSDASGQQHRGTRCLNDLKMIFWRAYFQ
jgi:hypothetical protein